MTNQNNAAQAAVNTIIAQHFSDDPAGAARALIVVNQVLSKLRATVADESVELPPLSAIDAEPSPHGSYEVYESEYVKEYARSSVLADRQKRAALASAPVADERAEDTLTQVYDTFGIGVLARNPSTLMACLGNVIRRANCLSQIERVLSVPTPPEPEDDGVWGEERLLRWGADEKGYAEHFKAALAEWSRRAAQASTPVTATPAQHLSADEVDGLIGDQSVMSALADGLESINGNENAELAAVIIRRMASAPVVPQACPTDVCQAAKADGVLCSNDECDRSNGVRPASAPVAGEAQKPVAWANWKVGTDSYVPYRTREEAQACVRRSAIAATQEGPYEVVALYAAPQASAEYERGHDDGWAAGWDQALKQRQASEAVRVRQLEAARIAYAREFPPDENGDPDVGNIHANIRKLKSQLAALPAQPSGNPGELAAQPGAQETNNGENNG